MTTPAPGTGRHRFAMWAWDDGLVIFDRESGATHALNALTAQVFREAWFADDNGGAASHPPPLYGDSTAELNDEASRSWQLLADAGLMPVAR